MSATVHGAWVGPREEYDRLTNAAADLRTSRSKLIRAALMLALDGEEESLRAALASLPPDKRNTWRPREEIDSG